MKNKILVSVSVVSLLAAIGSATALGWMYRKVRAFEKEHHVSILMTFTAPNCPMADQVLMEVKESVEEVPGVVSCSIEMTFEPAWDRSMLSDEARVELGLDGFDEPEE